MRAANFNLQVNAGHGINYRNIALIHKIPHLTELNIGHSIVARAILTGFEAAVREMLALMKNYNDLKTDQPATAFYTNDFLPK